MKKPPRSLFRMDRSTPELPAGDSIRKLMELFSQRTSAVLIRDHLQVIEAAAADAERNEEIEQGKEHAEAIRANIHELRASLAENDIHRAVVAAIKLTERWMMLRYDTLFATAVRGKEAQILALQTVTDGHIVAEWRKVQAEYPKADDVQQRKHLAGRVGLTEKQALARLRRLNLNERKR